MGSWSQPACVLGGDRENMGWGLKSGRGAITPFDRGSAEVDRGYREVQVSREFPIPYVLALRSSHALILSLALRASLARQV